MCTGGLASFQGLALVTATDGEDVDVVLGLGQQVGKGELVPGGGQALILGTASTDWLVAQAVAVDAGKRCHPADGEGVGGNLGEGEVSGGVESWEDSEMKKSRGRGGEERVWEE